MKLKVGDPVEFDATVRGMYPQNDTELLVALEVYHYGRVSVHDHWLRRSAEGLLSEGEDVSITGKVASVRDDVVGVRVDGNAAVIILMDADRLRVL